MPIQIGSTLYGQEVNGGFGSYLSLGGNMQSHSPDTHGGAPESRRLTIGSKSEYAQLWSISYEDEEANDWHRLDDEELLKHPDGKEGGDVVVEFAGSGLTVFIGYPSFYDGRGMVQAYNIINDTVVEKPDCIHERYAALQGSNLGDRFGADVSTDVYGNFVVVGTDGGGFVRAASFDTGIVGGGFRRVGSEIKESENTFDFGSSVATGRVPYGGCPQCGFTLEHRRVAVGSSAKVYQFASESGEWVWYQIAEHSWHNGLPLKVSMSEQSLVVVVGTPDANDGQGRVDTYRILDLTGDHNKQMDNRKNSTDNSTANDKSSHDK